jgi:eukaryotic-like serine/threonine-protein kinase
MTPERYQRMKGVFYAAQELAPERREQFLAQSCDGDQELRGAVEELLASAKKVEAFIEKPAYAVIAQSLADDSPTVEGKRIGQYVVARKLGEGGMGAVYLARRADDVYQKHVAIKLIRHGFDNAELLRRFYNERQILARLDHPNIARLLDGGATEDDLPYYVMDYVEGRPLLEYCDEKNLSTEERLKLFRLVCSAVQHAHQNLIIHRDLKPNNILVTKDGTPKLLDFGIAKAFQPEAGAPGSEATITELRVMTPEYASPEQIVGKHVTTASDVYSLGVILYQLLTGQRPYHFRSQSPQDIAQAICEQEPERPSAAVSSQWSVVSGKKLRARDKEQSPEHEPPPAENGQRTNPQSAIRNPKFLKGDLDNIVLMSLRKEPGRRYATVEQFSEDIRRHLQGLPVIARRDTFAYRGGKFVKRNRYAVTAAAVVMLLLLAGGVGIIRQGTIARTERDRAQKEKVKAERINKFFQDMLARANSRWYAPGNGKKQDVTVIEALNEATAKIENELNDEPEVKAEVLTTIGDTYSAVGRDDLAERPFELALELRRSLFGEGHIKVAESLYYLGGVKSLLGKYAEGEALFLQALEIQRQKPNEGNNLPYMLLDYGSLIKMKGDYGGAEGLYREAMEIFRQRNGADHITVGIAHDYLGLLNFERGELDKAYDEFQEALRLLGSTQNFYLARVYERIAQIQSLRKNYDEAESLFHKALQLYLLSFNENHYTPTSIKAQLAQLACDRGECEKAKKVMESILSEQKNYLGEDSKEYSALLESMGAILIKNGDQKRAEVCLRQALSIREHRADTTSNEFAYLKGELGECLLAQRRYAEAEPLLKESYDTLKRWHVPQSPDLQTAADRLKKLAQGSRKQ